MGNQVHVHVLYACLICSQYALCARSLLFLFCYIVALCCYCEQQCGGIGNVEARGQSLSSSESAPPKECECTPKKSDLSAASARAQLRSLVAKVWKFNVRILLLTFVPVYNQKIGTRVKGVITLRTTRPT
jgi:hypothetical protein